MKVKPRFRNRYGTFVVLFLSVTAVAGCNITDTLYVMFIAPLIPSATVEAEHSMADSTVLIWIDDTTVGPRYHSLRRELTAAIRTHLEEHDAIGSTVPYEAIARFRTRHPEYIHMTIQELGERFQAQQVLYLFINQFQFLHEAGRGYYQPGLQGSCKVVDGSTGARLWPNEQSYQTFAVRQDMVEGKGTEFEDDLIQKLSAEVATKIAPYFYKHKKDE